MTHRVLRICLLLLGAASAAWSQGSGSVATPPSVSGVDGSPFQITKSITGTVREISAEVGRLIVEDQKKKTFVEMRLVASKLRVSNRKTLADVMAGSLVRVQYGSEAGVHTALELRILEQPKS